VIFRFLRPIATMRLCGTIMAIWHLKDNGVTT